MKIGSATLCLWGVMNDFFFLMKDFDEEERRKLISQKISYSYKCIHLFKNSCHSFVFIVKNDYINDYYISYSAFFLVYIFLVYILSLYSYFAG